MRRASMLSMAPVIAGFVAAGGFMTPAHAGGNGTSAIGFYQKYISDLRYGNCQFDPSCSQYAADAVAAHGLLKGSVLAADRLLRCNRGAHSFYAYGGGGRLLDPVGPADRSAAVRHTPRIPDWLLPASLDPPLPMLFSEIRPLDLPPRPREPASRLLEYAAFADALVADGELWRAETEYKRIAFLARTPEVKRWSHIKIGTSYYRAQNWRDAAEHFGDALRASGTDDEREDAMFMVAASRFNAGDYASAHAVLNERGANDEAPSHTAAEKIDYLHGFCAMAVGDWRASGERFQRIVADYPDSAHRGRALYLRWKAEEGVNVPQKRAHLAAGLSAFIPGMGQLYAGRAYDGLRHFLLNGLLIYSVYELMSDEHYAAGYIVAGVTLPFYLGNVVGAKRSAEWYNASTRAEYVSTVIRDARFE